MIAICKRCGKDFSYHPYRDNTNPPKYCNYECYWGEKVLTNCLTCGAEIHTPPSRIAEGRGKYCSRKCSTQRHENNINVSRHVGGLSNGKRRFDYQLVAERALGRPLKKGEVIHHVDGNPRNCNSANLVICTQSFHRYLHRKDLEGRKQSCL